MHTGIYPGSFDPFTLGHMDVLKRASRLLDKVIVSILPNTSKKPFFTLEERLDFINEAIKQEGLCNVCCHHFNGLLVDFASSMNADYIIRGLRAVMDFEHEFQLNSINRKLAPGIETIYFMAEPEYSFIRSSHVREICSMGGSIDGLVPDINKKSIIERLTKKG